MRVLPLESLTDVDDTSGSSDGSSELVSSSDESLPPTPPVSEQKPKLYRTPQRREQLRSAQRTERPRTPQQKEQLTPEVPRRRTPNYYKTGARSSTPDQNSNYNRVPTPHSRAPSGNLVSYETLRPDHVASVSDVRTTSSDDEEEELVTNMFVDVSEEMFVGREKQLTEVGQKLEKYKVAAVSGMGGSGKTTFACLYAYRNKMRYKNGIFFVDASNIKTLPFNFAALAGPDVLNLVPCPDEDVATSTKLVVNWLSRKSKYLLIYDAADDVTTLEELGKQRSPAEGYRYIPPRVRLRGHVLITSRCPEEKFDTLQLPYPVALGDMTLSDAYTFLSRRVYNDRVLEPEERSSLEKLLHSDALLGKLPLNMEQTASYIRRQNLTFGEYLEKVSKRAERNPVGNPSFGDNRKTIDDAFVANFESVAETSAEAAVLLNMAALCHSRNIPFSLFSVGALALTRAEAITDEGIGELVDCLMADINEDDLLEKEVFKQASAAGKSAIRDLLAIPHESQLVKYARGSQEFTVHEVIQQQLRLRMKEQDEMVPAMTTLATILLYMMQSDDVSLSNKRLFLAHAEKCADHMLTFGPPERLFTDLLFRLRTKTAYVFALLGSFPTAWEIINDLECKLPLEDSELLRAELLGLKARICVWQHMPNEALRYGRQGLELLRFGADLDYSNLNNLTEYAFLRKSCAHALISLFETESDDVKIHLREAKRMFEIIMKSSSTNCQEEYAHLLMLHGLLHRNIAARRPVSDNPPRRHAEWHRARDWLRQAHDRMDTDNYVIETCRTHLYLAEYDLGLKSHEEVIRDLVACREALDVKLGRYHRYTAWVLGKTARLLMDTNHVSEALAMIQESLEIQGKEYGEDCGMVQMGQTKLLEGEAFIKMSLPRRAVETLEAAERLLEKTPKNPAYNQVRERLEEARKLTNLPPRILQQSDQYSSKTGQYSALEMKSVDRSGCELSGYSASRSHDQNQNSLALGLSLGGCDVRCDRKPAVHDERGRCDYTGMRQQERQRSATACN